MTRELLIEGQHVDLAPDTDITLEFVNNIVGDIGKISLSRSYTVKIPKTIRNTRILDDPGHPGHESGVTRRYMNARYYRNGIDLIGPAQAYILKTTPESYEIALVWNTLEALQALSQYNGTLNDLPELPVLTWIGSNGTTPDYTGSNDYGGAFFAFYNSGLGRIKYPTVGTATHPSMWVGDIIDRIIGSAGVGYTISAAAQGDIQDVAVLAAPNRAPTRDMEYFSGGHGIMRLYPRTLNGATFQGLHISAWSYSTTSANFGWDGPTQALSASVMIEKVGAQFGVVLSTGDIQNHRLLLNLRTSVNMKNSNIYIQGLNIDTNKNITARETLLKIPFRQAENGDWYIHTYEELSLSGWPYYGIAIEYYGSTVNNVAFGTYDKGSSYNIIVHRVHEHLPVAKDNRFPLQGNLPDIKQWDFIKACMAMFGWAAVIQNGRLQLMKYSELLDTSNAYDWTAKVDMTDKDPQEFSYTLDNWARVNTLLYEKDTPLSFDPDASLEVQDATLSEQRDYYKLPFAASMQSDAPHYKVSGTEVEDVDIAPRIFKVVDRDGVRTLEFTEDLYGSSLVGSHYARFQEMIRKPVRLTLNIRLHEIDLAQLDLTRAVYLGQYGKYYMILKIQTSDTDLCKVELIQLP